VFCPDVADLPDDVPVLPDTVPDLPAEVLVLPVVTLLPVLLDCFVDSLRVVVSTL
jgi:hypothetical protein